MISAVSIFAVPFMIGGIVFFGLFRKIDVYDSFVEGAKNGLESMVRIVAPLVGLIVGISMLRASGILDMFEKAVSPVTGFFQIPSDVLPLALLRPVSGSGSIAVVNDIFGNCGADSVAGRIASVMMGSTETTFYTIAVYFGAVGIKSVRHTAKSALAADFTGMVMSILVVKMMLN